MSRLHVSLRIVLVFGVVVGFVWELKAMGRFSDDATRARGLEPSPASLAALVDEVRLDKAVSTESSLQQDPPRPRKINLHSKNVIILHIGKSAGGTLNHRVRQEWRIFVEQCHPAPCNDILRKPDNQRYLFVTLRDPIDRFVSAFYWRAFMVCHPDETKRLWDGPPRGCKANRYKKEAKILYLEYNLNASRLAQDLCSHDVDVRTNAESALRTIEHAKWSIHDFLDFDWRRHAQRLYPLVVERGIDSFENQTDAAVHWLHKQTQFEPPTAFAQRHLYLQSLNRTGGGVSHSAHALKKNLTVQAEQCLARFYSRDYEILDEVRQLACKTQACRQGLASILSRRASLVVQSTIKAQ